MSHDIPNLPVRAGDPKPYHWSQDALASVVVFFVALPLCMGIALASGAPVAAGLITGIIGGLVTGALAGCPLQVSGPAAGLTVIVYEIVQHLGLERLGLAVLVAGGFQMAAGLLKLGQWFRAVSPAVINGMLAGIGVLIFASQFHVMIDDKPRKSGLENLISLPDAVWKATGIPHLAPEAEREFRTQALKSMSVLTHDQTKLRTLVGDQVPYYDHAHVTPELRAIEAPELAELADDQAKLSARLEELDTQLVAVESEVGQSQHLDRAHDALEAAQDRSAEAEQALRDGRAVDAVETQLAVVTALETATARLKNHRMAALLGVMTILVIMLWQKFAPQKLRLVPGPLIAVSLAMTIAATMVLPVLYVEVPGNLLNEINFPTRTLLTTAPWGEIIQAGLIIALVASAETLLCAAAVDQLSPGMRTNYDRELFSQGVGNTLCGLLGALPMTGVIVRSSANIQAGARTRLSAVLHGVWLVVFVVAFAWLLKLIPTASLAAVLVYTGYKLVNVKAIRKLKQFGWGEVFIYFATLGTIVVEDLLTGVIVGVALAAGKLLYTFSHLKIRVDHDGRQNRYMMHLQGAATFVRLPQLAAALEQIPENTELHVELDRLSYIDHACLDLFTHWANQHEATGGRLVIDWDSLHASFRRAPVEEEIPEHEAA
jgi:MFS superfamily sulfate permease-like transporter